VRENLAITLCTRRRHGHTTLLALAIVVALVGEAVAQSGGNWLLVVPPLIPEKRALINVYAASSAAEVRAAVGSLPEREQVVLVTKVYGILSSPTALARAEALLDVLQDTSAPVAAWRQIGAFDSAAVCERQRQLALERFERDASRVRSGSTDSEELSDEDWKIVEGLSTCRQSRCIPASAFFSR
jgi:hypothetical protein